MIVSSWLSRGRRETYRRGRVRRRQRAAPNWMLSRNLRPSVVKRAAVRRRAPAGKVKRKIDSVEPVGIVDGKVCDVAPARKETGLLGERVQVKYAPFGRRCSRTSTVHADAWMSSEAEEMDGATRVSGHRTPSLLVVWSPVPVFATPRLSGLR